MTFKVHIPTDEEGMTGRECPVNACLGYFKIKFGTGLKGENLPCVCPYCGHRGAHNTFWTKEQLAYLKSLAVREARGILVDELKKLEFNIPPRGSFGIGISLKVKEGSPPPIRFYREKRLETKAVCTSCTLEYAIYGVFGFCPDCGIHNSLQILNKNFEHAEKELALAGSVDEEFAAQLIGDALENAISAFDGYGRETCRVHATKASDPEKAEKLKFQNIKGAQGRVVALFHFDLAARLSPDEWQLVCRCFQKRHLLAHKMGVIDHDYINSDVDPRAIVGRKVSIDVEEVRALIANLKKVGQSISEALGS
jgi:hypothetical protein